MAQETFDLSTSRLRLRQLILADAGALFAYRSLPEVARYQSWQPMSRDEAETFLRGSEETRLFQSGCWFQIAVCLPSGELIGDVGVHFDPDGAQIELGYTLSPAYQGFGYAREAVSALLDFFLLAHGMHRAFASVDPDNTPSIRLLESLGFRKEAHHLLSFLARGVWHDDAVYAILSSEWRAKPSLPNGQPKNEP